MGTENLRSFLDLDAEPLAISSAAEQALLAERGSPSTKINSVGPMMAADLSGHGCAGQIVTDIYEGADGHIYYGVSVWYECESYLEVKGEVLLF
jgi:hypothetical protein